MCDFIPPAFEFETTDYKQVINSIPVTDPIVKKHLKLLPKHAEIDSVNYIVDKERDSENRICRIKTYHEIIYFYPENPINPHTGKTEMFTLIIKH